MTINSRDKFPNLLELMGLTGNWIELGIAQGKFHEVLMEGEFKELYGVDRWNDHHSTSEYLGVLRGLNKQSNVNKSVMLRMTFDEALPLFPDGFFDFIYIDGYAHLGQEGGRTLTQWFPKLKKGGVFSGHDYHRRWPKTIHSVNRFFDRYNLGKPNLTIEDEFPSWWAVK